MSASLPNVISTLQSLSPSRLDATCRRLRRDLGSGEWKLAAGLVALKRSGAFRKLGYSTLSQYTGVVLQLSGQKTAALLRVGEVLRHHPRLSEAFRLGRICWAKVRAIQSIVTPETEQVWLEYAVSHSENEVLNKVTLSPRAWKRQRALEASLQGEPIVDESGVRSLLRETVGMAGSVPAGEDNLGEDDRCPLKGRERGLSAENDVGAYKEENAKLTGSDAQSPTARALNSPEKNEAEPATGSDTSAAKEGSENGTPLPSTPKTIRLTFHLTPDQYALYEAAKGRVRSQAGRCLPGAAVLTRMAETVLDTGTSRSRAKHQVLIHTLEGTDLAWYDTDRGALPVDPAVLEKARTQRDPLPVHPLKKSAESEHPDGEARSQAPEIPKRDTQSVSSKTMKSRPLQTQVSAPTTPKNTKKPHVPPKPNPEPPSPPQPSANWKPEPPVAANDAAPKASPSRSTTSNPSPKVETTISTPSASTASPATLSTTNKISKKNPPGTGQDDTPVTTASEQKKGRNRRRVTSSRERRSPGSDLGSEVANEDGRRTYTKGIARYKHAGKGRPCGCTAT